MFNEEPKRPPAEIFDAVRFDDTIFARLLVPATFKEVILADVPVRPATVMLELNKFARFDVPVTFMLVDVTFVVVREFETNRLTIDAVLFTVRILLKV
jgi:hypothetical protein